MRSAALLTLLCFGCAASRPPTVEPVALSGPAPLRVELGEPVLELWMEGTHRPSTEETEETLAVARTALATALEGRAAPLASGADPDAFLVVRERAVARTAERRHAQVWSVVGAVALVAVVVVAVVVLSQRSSPRRPVPVAAPARAPFPSPGPWRGRAYAPAPSSFFFGWSLGVVVPLGPPPPPSPADVEPSAPPPADATPAPDPLLEDRGWLDGDEVELVAELVDAQTGDVRWRRALREGADPRDARAVSALLDRLVAGQPFGQRGTRTIGVRRDPEDAPEGPPAGATDPSPEGAPSGPAAEPDRPASALPDAAL